MQRPLTERARRAAWAVFALALASYVLSFVHRTAPAAIAGELTRSFSIGSAVLGTLAATYFYVYTLLQIPVGVLADTLGPRRILAGGAAVAAGGSLLFGLAPGGEVAAGGGWSDRELVSHRLVVRYPIWGSAHIISLDFARSAGESGRAGGGREPAGQR